MQENSTQKPSEDKPLQKQANATILANNAGKNGAPPTNTKLASKVHQLKAEVEVENAKTPVDYEKKARKRRKKRAVRLVQKLVIFVIAPTLAATVYYVHFAKDQFMSTSGISVKTEGNIQMGMDSILGAFAPSGTSMESVTVKAYILSRDMLRILDEKEKFIAHYQNQQIDYLARLPADASFEEAFKYYQTMVGAVFDAESGILTLEVKAFDAKSANRFARTIIAVAEEKVNTMSSKMQADKINFTKDVVKDAETRLAISRKNILKLQHEGDRFNPQRTAAGIMAIINQLEGALMLAQTQLSEARATMSPSAPKVQALVRRVQSLKGQIKKENKRLIDPEAEEGGLGESMADFEMAMLEKELAQKEYQSALVSLEMSRLEAMKQSRYLIEISSPSLPDEATYPIRWLKIVTVFLVSLAVFGVFSLLISAVKEHARI